MGAKHSKPIFLDCLHDRLCAEMTLATIFLGTWPLCVMCMRLLKRKLLLRESTHMIFKTFLKISLCLKYDIDLSPRASRSTLGWPISSSQCTLWQNFHPPILQLNCLIKHSPFAPTVGYLLSQQKCKGPANLV